MERRIDENNTKIDVIYTELSKGIDTISQHLDDTNRIDELNKRLDDMNTKLNERIDHLADTIMSLSMRIDRLAEKIEENTVAINELKTKEKIIEDIRRLQKLEDRVFTA